MVEAQKVKKIRRPLTSCNIMKFPLKVQKKSPGVDLCDVEYY